MAEAAQALRQGRAQGLVTNGNVAMDGNNRSFTFILWS